MPADIFNYEHIPNLREAELKYIYWWKPTDINVCDCVAGQTQSAWQVYLQHK